MIVILNSVKGISVC